MSDSGDRPPDAMPSQNLYELIIKNGNHTKNFRHIGLENIEKAKK